MMPKPRYLITTAVVLAAAFGTWLVTSDFTQSVGVSKGGIAYTERPGPLDGMTFAGFIGSSAEPKRTKDKFVFSNGKFASTECERVCGYLAGTYFVREVDGKTEFLSVSHCTYKDAKIEWRGTIQNGVVEGVSIWTVNRWYRTVEKKLVFKGKLEQATTPVAKK